MGLDGGQAIRVTGKIFLRGRRQGCAVEYRHRMTAREQCRGDIEPDETGTAEDKDPHFSIRTHRAGPLIAASHRNSVRDPYPPPNVRLVSPPRPPPAPGSARRLLRPNP